MKGFILYGWVVIYDHIHLLFQPNDVFDISKVMHFLKRHFTRDANWIMNHSFEGGIRETRLRGGVYDKFQPIVDEYDKRLKLLKFRFKIKYLNHNRYPRFQWKESFHDHYIRNESDFDHHMEYIAYNPVKHNLPFGWPYVFTNPEYGNLTDDIL